MQSRLKWLFFFVTILSVVSMAARVPLDTDMWWHIRSGEVMMSTHQPLLVDDFSYTLAGEPWINHSWLAQLVLAFLYRNLSYVGLMLYVVMLSVVTFALLFFLIEGHPFIRSLLIIFAGAVISPVWSPRPQLFTLLCLTLLVYLVDRYRKGSRAHSWFIPILFLLWGNLHGGYFTGILFLIFSLLGFGFERWLGSGQNNFDNGQCWQLLKVTLISIPALLINPNGLRILKVPFDTVNVRILRDFIDEWASPDFHQPLQLLFLLLFLGTVFFMSVNQQRKSAVTVFPFLGFAVLAFIAKRNIAPMMIVLLPLLSVQLKLWLEEVKWVQSVPELFIEPNYGWKIRDDNPPVMKFINLFLIFLIGLVAAGKAIYVSHPIVVNAYLSQQVPVQAYQTLDTLSLSGNILNEYGWGGYQIFHHPQYPVFVDGRTDLYGDEVIGEWMGLMRADGDYAAELEDYAINAVLLQQDRPLVNKLLSAGWQEQYVDQASVLLVRPLP
jgi:hypothetical protein